VSTEITERDMGHWKQNGGAQDIARFVVTVVKHIYIPALF